MSALKNLGPRSGGTCVASGWRGASYAAPMRRALPVLFLLATLPLAGCAGHPAAKPTPTAATVSGSMALGVSAYTDEDTVAPYDATTDTFGDAPAAATGDSCDATDGYTDIASGAEVDVVDGSGKVLAIGNLAAGKVGADTASCVFTFEVPDVPMGLSIYGVKVGNGNRGIVHFSRAQMFGGTGPALSLG